MSQELVVGALVWVTLLTIILLIIVAVGWSKTKRRESCPKSASAWSTTDGPSAESVVVIPVLGTGGVDEADTGFQTILESYICTSSCENRLAATVSAVTNLSVAVESEAMPTGGSLAIDLARIEMRTLVDGIAANPGSIVFDQMARITEVDPQTAILAGDELETNEAHSFTFLASNVCPGCHHVQVQARAITTALYEGLGAAGVLAIVGSRTLLVLPSKDASCTPPSSSSSRS